MTTLLEPASSSLHARCRARNASTAWSPQSSRLARLARAVQGSQRIDCVVAPVVVAKKAPFPDRGELAEVQILAHPVSPRGRQRRCECNAHAHSLYSTRAPTLASHSSPSGPGTTSFRSKPTIVRPFSTTRLTRYIAC
jgi:hypothetical protein